MNRTVEEGDDQVNDDADMEALKQDLEEDPELRRGVNMYRTGMETEQPATGAEQQADKSDAEDSDSDAPEVPLAELLEGLVLRDT